MSAETHLDPSQRLTHLAPLPHDWKAHLNDWASLLAVSKAQLDFLTCAKISRALDRIDLPADALRMKLAIAASSTTHHLVPALRVAALRRGIVLDVYECGYGQYMQEIATAGSPLHSFAPQVLLIALDAPHLAALAAAGTDPVEHVKRIWRIAREQSSATVIQQTSLPVFPALLGSNEYRYEASPAAILARFNRDVRVAADEEGISIFAVEDAAARDGVRTWHDAALWFRAKQEVHPAAAPLYAEALAPMLAAVAGRSKKCLVLDLDNTLWGGVIGDDGMDGIMLGEGHAAGEAFLRFQNYCLALRERGVLLAVCSKNDEAIALAAVEQHPAMVLRREHFAAFVANWNDKPQNLRTIAEQLNLGTDALVFADDNPFEREMVRRAMPEVAVPEMGDDPSNYAERIANGGYFEQLSLTADDLARVAQYRENIARAAVRASSTDVESYLQSMKMVLTWKPFDEASLARIVQLIGKTNQFNLTTRRYGSEEVRTLMANPKCVLLQFGLTDAFGDNGTIALVMAHVDQDRLRIDNWLMSCRVLGRRVEEATLRVLVQAARQRGVSRIVGEFLPTAKNGIVSDLYPRLGFAPSNGLFELDIESLKEVDLPMTILSA